MSRSRGRLRTLLTASRTALWPVPVAAVALALVLGVLLPRLDRAVDEAVPPFIAGLLFSGGPGAARTLLDAIASSLMTVTSLTFSLTVVTLQLASSQFSPRLLRTFARDRFVHWTLAIFLSTFMYALTVERTVRSADEGGSAFVPRLSVTFGFLLTVASVISLVLFLAHLSSEIRVETMLARVHDDARATARAVLGDPLEPEQRGAGRPPVPRLHAPPAARVVTARESGFVVGVDEQVLLEGAVRTGAVLLLDTLPGASVVAGTPLGQAWSQDGTPLDDDALEQLAGAVAEAVEVGAERTEAQDVAFGLRQMTDVAVRALSPGINDPTTAVHALSHSSAFVCEVATHRLGPTALYEGDAEDQDAEDQDADGGDRRGRLRVVVARPTLAGLLDLAVSAPRRYGAGDPTVLARLYDMLREVAWTTAGNPDAATVVDAQRRRLLATAEDQDYDDEELAALRDLDEQVRQVLARHGAGSGAA